METKESFLHYIRTLQDALCTELEEIDEEARFVEDLWKRPGGGGGRTRVMQNGRVVEKGGINTSAIHGKLPPAMMDYLQVTSDAFFACGISLVIHPRNPFAPTAHANFRFFEIYDAQGNAADAWFGGGMDLTPYYLFDEDAEHFHQVAADGYSKIGEDLYPRFKQACDQYFFNSHRNEARGVGGTFFDHLGKGDLSSKAHWESFTKQAGDCFALAYYPILRKRSEMPFDTQHRKWQEIRRGRYVEFNLIHDKGTLFGLKTQGRIESILMSLPPVVQWEYDYQVEPGTEEARLLEVLKEPRTWV